MQPVSSPRCSSDGSGSLRASPPPDLSLSLRSSASASDGSGSLRASPPPDLSLSLRSSACALLLIVACVKGGEETVDPKVRADGYYLAGQTAFLANDYAGAHAKFAEVRKLVPDDARLPSAEGEVFLAESNLAEAIRCFEDAVKRDPKRATPFSRLGYLYSLKGENEKAVTTLNRAIALNSKDFNALETLGDVALKADSVDEAVKHYLAASEVAPEGARADLVLKVSSVLSKKGRGLEVLPIIEAAVKRGVTSPELMADFADRLVGAGRLAEAVDAYTTAAKGNAKDPALWELAGEVNARLDRLDAAETAFRESLKVKDRSVVHVALARLCQRRAVDGGKSDAGSGCVAAELDLALKTAAGEELREAYELSDLLASVGRTKDALLLLKQLSEEPEQKKNLEVHLKTAALAKAAGDAAELKASCARALVAGHSGKCP